MPDVKLQLPVRLVPYLHLDTETGEVVARLSPEALEAMQEAIHEGTTKTMLEEAYESIQRQKHFHDSLHEYLLHTVMEALPDGAEAQYVDDALYMACTALNKSPNEVLLALHEFFMNYQSIVEHSQPIQAQEEVQS